MKSNRPIELPSGVEQQPDNCSICPGLFFGTGQDLATLWTNSCRFVHSASFKFGLAFLSATLGSYLNLLHTIIWSCIPLGSAAPGWAKACPRWNTIYNLHKEAYHKMRVWVSFSWNWRVNFWTDSTLSESYILVMKQGGKSQMDHSQKQETCLISPSFSL